MPQKRSNRGYLLSALGCHCPRCREGKLFKHSVSIRFKKNMEMNPQCPVCGQPTEIEVGFYYGTSYVSYALAVAISFASLAAWWLIIGLTDAEQRLGLLRSNAEYHFSAVNVSGQRTTIELEGPHASEVLAHLWEQDLREKRFPVGCVSQGLMGKAPVIVCHMAPLRYRVMVRSSFAAHLWKGIVDAAGGWK
ncbi:MAG: hypothetical protein EOO00_01680 [Chitinophagaceae bacterium]|nr:MAG: hypothetical protein EOO00_01680 [Chitinophagaceae bacterium]